MPGSLWMSVLATLLLGVGVATAQDTSPLEPADTSSPRATLESFLDNMKGFYRLSEGPDAQADPDQATAFKARAIRCLDLGAFDLAPVEDLGERRAVLLMEILDRIEVLPEAAPDSARAEGAEITRWRLPGTDIAITRVADGPRQGEYLFSPETVARIPEFHERVKSLPYKPGTVMEDAFEKIFIAGSVATEDASPLEPADTSSPRATLRSFIDSMNAVYSAFKAEGVGREAIERRRDDHNRAVSCLDLSEVPPAVLQETERAAGIQLMEVFDRIELPEYDRIPGPIEAGNQKVRSWTIPKTEITIARVEEGPRRGEYLFAPATVARVREFYERVERLPYKDGTVLEDAYEFYMLSPEPTIPISWVSRLPSWMKRIALGQAIWKWVVLGGILLLLLGGLALAFRLGSRRREDDARAPFLRRVVFPIGGIALALLAEAAVTQLRVAPDVMVATSASLTILLALGTAWLVAMVADAVAEAIIATPRINSKSIDAQLVRIAFRIGSLVAFVFILLETTERLGVPLTPVLAGLGVGGVAIALAAQNSVENLIGGFNLFVDRPVKVGDFCRFGDRTGTIEEIGLRSTRVRSLDDTVISIPNATFSKMELENYSKRRKIGYHPRLRLAKTTTPDQVRFVLVEVRRMLYAHPMVDPDQVRIRFVEFGESSLDLDIFAFVAVTDYGASLEVAEDLNLRIMDILSRGGVSLAVPTQRTLLERAAPAEPDRVREAEERVDRWREDNELYLPAFPEDVVTHLRRTLDYPPKGSPAANPGSTCDPTGSDHSDDRPGTGSDGVIRPSSPR